MSASVYRWAPGMQALDNLDRQYAGLVARVIVDAAEPSTAKCRIVFAGDDREWHSFSFSPDLDHGPTRGALLDQVRELSGHHDATTCVDIDEDGDAAWSVRFPLRHGSRLLGTGDTEGAALMDALARLAPKAAAAEPVASVVSDDLRPLVRTLDRIRALHDLGANPVRFVDGRTRCDEAALDETVERVRTAARNADRLEAIERRHADEMRRLLNSHADMRRQLDAALAERDTMRRKLADAQLDDPRATLALYGWQCSDGLAWKRRSDDVTVERGVITITRVLRGVLVSDEMRAFAALADEQTEDNS